MLSRREWLAASTAAAVSPFCTRLGFAQEKATAPADSRLGAAKTLNDYFPFIVPKTKDEWAKRRDRIREQMLVANGLWPLPEKPPLDAVLHGKIDRDTYTIEKVFFRSAPGHYLCGNLYRPKAKNKDDALRPAVLYAHGHWMKGRFTEETEATAKQRMAIGEEPDIDRGRYHIQAGSITLAKLGFVVFQYDMIGVADTTAIDHIARSGVPHPNGFADAEGELRLQSLMGLQTWNSIRAVDFVSGLPDVDPKKIGVTGASGGGTQSFVLAAVDDRIAVSAPAVMVSTGMQGGCVCENCSLFRTGTGNVEMAAVFAPKPQLLLCANDWTKEFLTKGYPELKQLYTLLGAPDNVLAKAWTRLPHNYGRPSRERMYEWFLKHLMGKEESFAEPPIAPTPPADLTVFDAGHPRPKDDLPAKDVRAKMSADSDAQLAKLTPTDAKSLAAFRTVVGGALRAMLCDELPAAIAVKKKPEETKLPGGVTVHTAHLGRSDEKDAVPTVGLFTEKFKDKVVVWVHPKGKASTTADGKPVPEVQTLLDAGYAVVAPDVLGVGELVSTKPNGVNQTYAGFTFGYNRSLLAERVHDVLTAIAFAKTVLKAKTIRLVGWDEFGVVAVLAKAAAGDAVDKLAADLDQFRFETITKTDDPRMLPGAVKYGGLGAFLALCAPAETLAHNHKGTASGKLSKAAFDAAGAGDKLTRADAKWEPAKVVEWLLK